MDFIEFLKKKRIEPDAFKSAKPVDFEKWSSEFLILGPKGFDQYYKFLFNEIRRTYKFTPPPKVVLPKTESKPIAKPAFKPKFGLKKADPASENNEEAKTQVPKPSFKPKIGVKKASTEDQEVEVIKPKPAFKPKVGVKKVVESEPEKVPVKKPAFKPKVGVKPKPEGDEIKPKSRPAFKPKKEE